MPMIKNTFNDDDRLGKKTYLEAKTLAFLDDIRTALYILNIYWFGLFCFVLFWFTEFWLTNRNSPWAGNRYTTAWIESIFTSRRIFFYFLALRPFDDFFQIATVAACLYIQVRVIYIARDMNIRKIEKLNKSLRKTALGADGVAVIRKTWSSTLSTHSQSRKQHKQHEQYQHNSLKASQLSTQSTGSIISEAKENDVVQVLRSMVSGILFELTIKFYLLYDINPINSPHEY